MLRIVLHNFFQIIWERVQWSHFRKGVNGKNYKSQYIHTYCVTLNCLQGGNYIYIYIYIYIPLLPSKTLRESNEIIQIK